MYWNGIKKVKIESIETTSGCSVHCNWRWQPKVFGVKKSFLFYFFPLKTYHAILGWGTTKWHFISYQKIEIAIKVNFLKFQTKISKNVFRRKIFCNVMSWLDEILYNGMLCHSLGGAVLEVDKGFNLQHIGNRQRR